MGSCASEDAPSDSQRQRRGSPNNVATQQQQQQPDRVESDRASSVDTKSTVVADPGDILPDSGIADVNHHHHHHHPSLLPPCPSPSGTPTTDEDENFAARSKINNDDSVEPDLPHVIIPAESEEQEEVKISPVVGGVTTHEPQQQRSCGSDFCGSSGGSDGTKSGGSVSTATKSKSGSDSLSMVSDSGTLLPSLLPDDAVEDLRRSSRLADNGAGSAARSGHRPFASSTKTLGYNSDEVLPSSKPASAGLVSPSLSSEKDVPVVAPVKKRDAPVAPSFVMTSPSSSSSSSSRYSALSSEMSAAHPAVVPPKNYSIFESDEPEMM